jgi:Uma2 family endonuclease
VTAMEHSPTRLYTVGEYAALGESEPRTELQEGIVVMPPSPSYHHATALLELAVQVRSQLPHGLQVVTEIDIDLQLDRPDKPGSVRRPDLVIGQRAAFNRSAQDGGLLKAADVLVAVEIVSPGSRRLDYTFKRAEYADAGIPHYWILDLEDPVSLLACLLTDEFGYVDNGETTGEFVATEPFPFKIDLESLVE